MKYEKTSGQILKAFDFAAKKHQYKKRKDHKRPYINHLTAVAWLLWDIGEVRDEDTLIAGVLHDTIEDTDTAREELIKAFGEKVCSIVEEVTDDGSLPKERRKELQVEHAPHLTHAARHIKLADKICNIEDILLHPPEWTAERKLQYIEWGQKVISGIRGTNAKLEKCFDDLCQKAAKKNRIKCHKDRIKKGNLNSRRNR